MGERRAEGSSLGWSKSRRSGNLMRTLRLKMSKDKARQTALYALTLVMACALVSVFPPGYSDSDSSCYSSIAQKLAFQPVERWCAPQWWGHGYHAGLFQDHPPGILWLSAVLVRLGIKKTVAALCANFIYSLLSLFFIFRLARFWWGRIYGWGAVFGFVLTPIFAQYLIRANQEPALNLAVVAGVYGLARSRESAGYKALFIVALVFAVVIKGLSALILSILALLYWLIASRNKKTLALVVLAHAITLGAAVLFEVWYRGIAQTGFWPAYLSFQGERTIGAVLHPWPRIYGFIWYIGRCLWFAFPWVFFIFFGWAPAIRKSKRNPAGDPFFRFLLVGALAILLFFSLSDRKADRYIFPAYTLLALAGVRMLLVIKPKVADFLSRHERSLPVWLAAGLTVFVFFGVALHSLLNHFIRLWPK